MKQVVTSGDGFPHSSYVRHLSNSLGEVKPQVIDNINEIVQQIGETKADALFAKAIEVYKSGTMTTRDGHPRTLGGIFFVLAKESGVKRNRPKATRKGPTHPHLLQAADLLQQIAKLAKDASETLRNDSQDLNRCHALIRRTSVSILQFSKKISSRLPARPQKPEQLTDHSSKSSIPPAQIPKKAKISARQSTEVSPNKNSKKAPKRKTFVRSTSKPKAPSRRSAIEKRHNKMSGIVLGASGQTRVAGSHRG